MPSPETHPTTRPGTESRAGLARRAVLALPIAAAGLSLAGVPALAATPRAVTAMAFNMHHGAGYDDVLDLEHAARVIEEAGADLVGLQEVDRHWGARSEYVDQTQWLARRLGMRGVFGANLDLAPEAGRAERRQYGTAVLSRYPIVAWQNHLLTSIPYPERPTEQRGLLQATVNVRGTLVDFCSTHLDHQRPEQRISQAREVVQLAEDMQPTAFVVGDLNAQPDTTEVQLIVDAGFADPFAGAGNFTYPAESPNARIDYLLGRGVDGWSDAQVIDTDASDHLPVSAAVMIGRRSS